MIVYGEVLILENIITGCVLLYITGEIFRCRYETWVKKVRLVTGSLICGLYSLDIFLPVKMPFLFFSETVFAFLVCLVSLGMNRLWQKAAVFVLTTYFMGGITMGLLILSGNTGIYTVSGVYTGDMKAAVMAMFTAAFFAAVRQIIRIIRRTKFYSEHSFDAVIVTGGASVRTSAFLDTANTLREPVSGSPCAVADKVLWNRMESAGMIVPERFCLIPYESVGRSGIMKGIRVDCINIGTRQIKNCVVAEYNERFCLNKAGKAAYELLLSRYMSEKGI